ncbi:MULTISPECIES: hypothetical protein [Nostoc]|nr:MULTISPECIES: hypothetical protein [Nostoc]MBD2679714.1 hypothetical protein [Nostoc sp. FACHB-857]
MEFKHSFNEVQKLNPHAQCPIPNTSLREAAPTASPFSTRGCANDYAQDKLSTSAQCPMPDFHVKCQN